jgi:type IV pilus assembly protein PilM
MAARRNAPQEEGSVEETMKLGWKRLLNIEQKYVLGLDIGSSAVKMVQMHKNNTGYEVTAAGIADIADKTKEDENGEEKNTVVNAISQCLESTGIQTQYAVCGVCGPEVAVRCFKFPSLSPEEVEGAVLLEAAQVCPFNIDDSAVDYQLIPDDENNVSGVMVAATNKLIETKRQFITDASLDSVLIDIDGLALLNCFRGCEKSEASQTTAILNIGASYANLAIIGDNVLPFIRDIAYAGNEIVKEIAAENNVSPETVSKILSGRESSDRTQLELGSSLAKAATKLAVDVTETLRYYTAQEKSTAVEKIFVCGGFALVKGLVELLDNQLPAKAVLWNPFNKIRCDAEQPCRDILQENGPAMAVAAGLAMRTI